MGIYFLQDTDGFIKIGKSLFPKRRICGVNRYRPIAMVLAIIDGYTEEEDELHARFRHLKTHYGNDWFEPGQDLIDYINSVTGNFKRYKPRSYNG